VAGPIHIGRAIATAGLLALLAVLALGGVATNASAVTCRHADDTHATASLKDLKRAIVCLVNDKRHDRGKHRLDRNGKLDQAAGRHTRQMLKKACFKDKCPGEPGLGGRIRETGYLQGATRWHYSESFGCESTPKQMVHAWMGTPFHRRNILKSKYRDIGVGAGKGVPHGSCNNNNALTTFTAVFAWREP
jgi:uncharacterized protein YkwD